jgi:hypothetical protein
VEIQLDIKKCFIFLPIYRIKQSRITNFVMAEGEEDNIAGANFQDSENVTI